MSFILFLLGMAVHLPAARLDDVALLARESCRGELRWDNVEGSPQWVCGSQPKHDHRVGMHLVHLLPGKSVTFKLPPRAMVRVISPNQRIEPDDIELWISNGTGLYRRQLAGISICDASLIAVPDEAQMGLARIVRPGSCSRAITFAIFTSRLETPEVVGGYRHELHGCGPKVALRDLDGTSKEHFYCLQRGHPARFSVSGPLRLAIETRMRYPPTESRMFQAYQLAVCSAGTVRKVLEYETSAETQKRVLVKGHEEVLGQKETAYLDVPPGDHKLLLDATASLLVRIGSTECREYLLPKVNQPPWLAPTQSVRPEPQNWISIWDIAQEQVHNCIYGTPQAVISHEQIALRSARDNRYRQGGLHSMMLMRAAAASRPDYDQIRTVADKLRSFHTSLRNLLPADSVDPCSQRVAWFYTSHVRDASDPLPELVLAEQHVENALGGLYKAHFLTVPTRREAALQFRLPVDLGTTFLRVVVDRGSLDTSTRIMLQYDDREAIPLYALATNELPASQFAPTRAEAALTGLYWQHGDFDSGTLGGPFSCDRMAADLISVAFHDIIVPGGVKEVKVWAEPPRAAAIMLALQYRDSRRYRLGESQCLELVRRLGADDLALLMSSNHNSKNHSEPFTHHELGNHFLPLARFLRTHERLFRAGVQGDAQNSAAAEPIPTQQQARQFETAVRLTDQQLWLPALETWSELLPHLTGPQRHKGLFARVTALQELQEAYLAELELRSLFLFDTDAEVRREAFNKLRQFHRRRGDLDAEERLLAVAVAQQPTYERLTALASVLVENGRYEYALMTALALPADQRPGPAVVRAAFQMQWWRVFHDAVRQLPDPRQRHYWLAQHHLSRGDYAAALRHFARAGQRGRITARHLRNGQQIHAMLKNPDTATRGLAVFEWEQWQARHPGPRIWREEESLIDSYGGSAVVYSVNADSYAQNYKAHADRPLSVSVLGPIRLKFEARPIHDPSHGSPIDDMLYIRAAGRKYLFPINDNRAATGQQIVGDSLHVPGRTVNAELNLGPGLHEFEVAAEATDLLVRVFVQRPEVPLPVLPPLNRDVLDAVLAGRYGAMVQSRNGAHVHLLPSCNKKPVDRYFVRQITGCGRCDRMHKGLNSLLAARLALRTGLSLQPYSGVLIDWATNIKAGNHLEKSLALSRLGQMALLRQSLADNECKIPGDECQAIYVAHGDYLSALDVVCEDDADALLQRMAVLVKLAESDVNQQLRAAVLGNQLVTHNPNLPSLAPSASRLTRYGTWKLNREVSVSSGLHGKSLEGWLPESPSLRVRKALLSKIRPGDSILSGYHHLVLAMQNPRPTSLRLSLSLGQLASLRSSALTLLWQLDEGPSHRIVLASVDSVQSLLIDVPQGAHRLQLWLDEPLANQYVVVRVREKPTTGPQATRAGDARLVRQTERLYHVATRAQPVRFIIDGPAWVRIDQLVGDSTVCHYLTVSDGDREFELKPPENSSTALFRIFEYRLDHNKKVLPSAIVSIEPEPLPAPWIDAPFAEDIATSEATNEFWLRDIPAAWGERLVPLSLLPPDTAPRLLELRDWLPLGGQEDGTWSLGTDQVSRRALDEGASGVAVPDRFIELNATHQYFDHWRDNYQKTGLLFRQREQSGPTFGLRYGRWHDSSHLPITIGLKGFAYIQRPSDAISPAVERLESSFGLSAQLSQRYDLSPYWYHAPTLSVFGRWLSRERPAYEPGRVDQDIFTQYKADNLTGMRLWDTFVLTPWLDSRWWIRPALITNENYDFTRPDHVYLRIGRSQLIGPLAVDVSYRIAEFYRDEHRANDSRQHQLALDGLAEQFTLAGRHCELEIGVAHDLSSGKTSAKLSWAAYFGNGRRLRDRYSGNERFLALRNQNAIQRFTRGR